MKVEIDLTIFISAVITVLLGSYWMVGSAMNVEKFSKCIDKHNTPKFEMVGDELYCLKGEEGDLVVSMYRAR